LTRQRRISSCHLADNASSAGSGFGIPSRCTVHPWRPHRGDLVSSVVTAKTHECGAATICPTQAEEGGVTIPWLRGLGLVGAVVVATTTLANTALAAPPPTPGIDVEDENSRCT